jgi:primosomal protein N' (replication factor Y)
VRVGTIVRVGLHGRRVRGWVVADRVEASTEVSRLRPLTAVVSAGPTPDVVELSVWIAHRWCGPRVAVLRSASAPNRAPEPPPHPPAVRAIPDQGPGTSDADRLADTVVGRAAAASRVVVRWPPLLDRRRLVRGLLASTGSTIVAVADGSRARALARWLSTLGHRTVVLHSDLSDRERTAEWSRATLGTCVVVGGRIAVLAPVPDLAAIVVVDDADEALQEERAPTWTARDVAVERARRAGARVSVVSASPTVVALAGLGESVAPAPAAERAGWPLVEVVDRREEPPGAGLFSRALTDALHGAIAAGGPAVCVLNRRGRQRLVACDACGEITRRDRTGAPLFDLAASGAPAEVAGAAVCPHCGSTRLRVLRSGVTRIREELEALLGRASVADVDADTLGAPDASVLIGTESVLRRHEVHARRPRLVAYLDLDQELLAPRARAVEQAFWLLALGARVLAGRPRHDTRLLVQTRMPGHEAVEALRSGDPSIVADAERARRRALGFPPFGALAELRGAHEAVRHVTASLTALLELGLDLTVLGPRADRTESATLVRAADAETLADALAHVVPPARALGRLRVVVDPPRV